MARYDLPPLGGSRIKMTSGIRCILICMDAHVPASVLFSVTKPETDPGLDIGEESTGRILPERCCEYTMYDDSTKEEQINKSNFKAYLEMVGSNLVGGRCELDPDDAVVAPRERFPTLESLVSQHDDKHGLAPPAQFWASG